MSLVGAALALAVTVPQALLNFPYVDRKDNFDARDFGMNHLRKLPRNSILIAKGDPVCSTIAYLQSVENIRPDVSVIWYSLLSEPWYHRWAAKRFPSLVFSAGNTRMQPTEALQAFVRRNYGHGRRIFLNQYYTQIPGPPLYYAQVYSGTLTEIRKDFPQQLDPGFWDYRYSDPLWFRRPARPHGHRRYSEKGVEHSERVQYERDMLYFEVQGRLDWARFHMDRRLFDLVVEAYDRIMTLDPDFGEVNTLNMFAIAYLQIGRLEKARDILLRVVELDPEWPLPYVTLSDISARLGDEPESKRYIEKALDLDPQILQKLGIR